MMDKLNDFFGLEGDMRLSGKGLCKLLALAVAITAIVFLAMHLSN